MRIIHRLSPAALATAATPPPPAARHHEPEQAGAAQRKPKSVGLRHLGRHLREFMRAIQAASGPRPGDPEMVENDYYRLRNHPRD